MKQLALAQEACAILGGRYDHPLTALPGGVSRFLKEELYERLGEIAEALLDGTQKTAAFFIETIFSNPKAFEKYAEVGIDPMAGMAVQGRDVSDPENLKEGEIVLTDRAGKQAERFAADKAKDKIDLATEPWTHVPFAYLKDKGWKGAESGADGPLFRRPPGQAELRGRTRHAQGRGAEAEYDQRLGGISPFHREGCFPRAGRGIGGGCGTTGGTLA